MSQTPNDSPYRWRAADLEAIRVALSIPARLPAIRAINDAMADLEQPYPDAIPTARREIDAIAAIDTELLREEITTRYGEGLSIEAALRRQRGSHAQALLLMLPTLANWSRDPQLSGNSGGFTAALCQRPHPAVLQRHPRRARFGAHGEVPVRGVSQAPAGDLQQGELPRRRHGGLHLRGLSHPRGGAAIDVVPTLGLAGGRCGLVDRGHPARFSHHPGAAHPLLRGGVAGAAVGAAQPWPAPLA